jgi:hypothetical protein
MGLNPLEKILCTVLHEAHGQQVEETMETLAEGPVAPMSEQDYFHRNPSPCPAGMNWAWLGGGAHTAPERRTARGCSPVKRIALTL